MRVAYAHPGSNYTSASDISWLTDWVFDPVFIIPLILSLFYLRGFWRHRAAGGTRFPIWRGVSYLVGFLFLGFALLSPVDELAGFSFTMHMVQHDLMMMVAIPLMMLGGPFVLTIRGIPRGFRQHVFIPLAKNKAVRWVVRLFTRPLMVFVLFEMVILFWHLPQFYDRALFNQGFHYLQHLTFIVASSAFWWVIITPYPFPSRLHLLWRALMIFGTGIINTLLGGILTFSEVVLYGYASMDGFMGLTMHQEQRLGGVLMWTMGGMIRLGVIILLMGLYGYQSEKNEPYRIKQQQAAK